MFQLTRNYRSHGGIVRCAQTVVDIITHLWPYSIDMLQEEKGLIDGPKPLFLGGGQTEVPHFEQFLYTVEYVERCLTLNYAAHFLISAALPLSLAISSAFWCATMRLVRSYAGHSGRWASSCESQSLKSHSLVLINKFKGLCTRAKVLSSKT